MLSLMPPCCALSPCPASSLIFLLSASFCFSFLSSFQATTQSLPSPNEISREHQAVERSWEKLIRLKKKNNFPLLGPGRAEQPECSCRRVTRPADSPLQADTHTSGRSFGSQVPTPGQAGRAELCSEGCSLPMAPAGCKRFSSEMRDRYSQHFFFFQLPTLFYILCLL